MNSWNSKTSYILRVFGKHLRSYAAERFGKEQAFLKRVHDMNAGETCFILGNGPSLRGVSNETLAKLPSFGTNGIFLKFLPTYYVTISEDFYKNHLEEIRRLKCEQKFIGQNLADLITLEPNETVLNCAWNLYGTTLGFHFPVPFRFSRNASKVVYTGGSVIFICLQIAYWMGFSRVILLGVDHKFGFPRTEAVYGGRRLKPTGKFDEIHFTEAYSQPGYTPHCDMIATERSFELALSMYRNDGREIWNATPDTGLNVIPKANLEDLI